MATGSHHDQFRLQFNPAPDCVVGGCVASVQGNQCVHFSQWRCVNCSLNELEVGRADSRGKLLCLGDKLTSCFHANDSRRPFPDSIKQMPCAQGQIGLAAAHVGEDQFPLSRPLCPATLFCQVGEDLEVMIDLPMFVQHGGPNLSRNIRNFEAMQPILSTRIQNASLGAIMVAICCNGESGFVTDQPRLALPVDEKLPVSMSGIQQ